MDVRAYLDRMGYAGPLETSLETLRELHRAHLLAVPFENLDIHLGRPIVLEAEALFAKIVRRRRGGFCYELNGLFAELLRRLGYRVTLLSAGVAREGGGFGPDFDHLALRVDLQEPWLADVGFGEGFRVPLRMDEREAQNGDGRAYRIRDRVLYRQEDGGAWSPQYRFSPEPRRLADFKGMCCYQQTSPDSHFRQGRVCTLATTEGRITLRDRRWIVTRLGVRTEQPFASEEEFRSLLREHFGIGYDDEPR